MSLSRKHNNSYSLNRKKIELLRTKTRRKYTNFRNPYWCKCLKRDIVFNAQGFHHLQYDGLGHERSHAEQKHKLVLVPLVPYVLTTAEDFTYRKVIEKVNRKKNAPKKEVEYWGITGIAGKGKRIKIKVVLKRVGNGNVFFWSVMRLNNKKGHGKRDHF